MITDYLLRNWERFIRNEKPDTIHVVPVSSCLKDYGNDIVLIFADQCDFPEYIMKISRDAKYAFKIKNEFSAMSLLHKSAKLKQFIPVPYYFGNESENVFLIQKGVQGNSLSKFIQKNGLKGKTLDLIEQSISILIDINTVRIDSLVDLYSKEELSYVFDLYRDDLVGRGLDPKVIDEMYEDYVMLRSFNRRYFLHGDFWQSNIIIDDCKVSGIIDWEFASGNSEVPTDIFWFLINLGYRLYQNIHGDAEILESFKWAFFERGPQSDVIFDCCERFAMGVGLDRGLLLNILRLTLLKMSIRELAAYGEHMDMDYVCFDMLKYLVNNEKNICAV